MTRRGLLVLVAVAVGVAVTSCSRDDVAEEPAWGKEPCAHCAMVLSDKRFGAQLVDGSGDRRFFDDVGCMVLFEEEHATPRKAWVRDARTGAWLEAVAARYSESTGTPMDFGIAAGAVDGMPWAAMRDAVLARSRRGR